MMKNIVLVVNLSSAGNFFQLNNQNQDLELTNGPSTTNLLDVRFNASKLIVTKVCVTSSLQVFETDGDGNDLPPDPPGIFVLNMSNSNDPIAEFLIDGTSRSEICHDVIWMPNMISSVITFSIHGVSLNTLDAIPAGEGNPGNPILPIIQVGPNTLATITVHMRFEE